MSELLGEEDESILLAPLIDSLLDEQAEFDLPPEWFVEELVENRADALRQARLERVRMQIDTIDKELVDCIQGRWVIAIAAQRSNPNKERLHNEEWFDGVMQGAINSIDQVMQDYSETFNRPYPHKDELEDFVVQVISLLQPIMTASSFFGPRRALSPDYKWIDDIYEKRQRIRNDENRTLVRDLDGNLVLWDEAEHAPELDDKEAEAIEALEEEQKAVLNKSVNKNNRELVYALAIRLELALRAARLKEDVKKQLDPSREEEIIKLVSESAKQHDPIDITFVFHVQGFFRAFLATVRGVQAGYIRMLEGEDRS